MNHDTELDHGTDHVSDALHMDRVSEPMPVRGGGEYPALGASPEFPPARLVKPSGAGFLVLAAEIDRRPPIGWGFMSRRKRRALSRLKEAAMLLRAREEVAGAAAFRAILVPPGQGKLLRERPHVPVARFDALLLVEFTDPVAARTCAKTAEWISLRNEIDRLARRTIEFTATNPARMGPVDASRDGVFLFNWFYADDPEVNLAVWKGTAGWFERTTGLHNSTPLRPDTGSGVPYTLINHCRWDRLAEVLPALVRPSFRSHVLANFERHNTAATPILYRLA